MYKFVIKEQTARNITKTQNFLSWFGNSQIKDAQGNPQILYHGTNSKEVFSSFSPSTAGSLGPGIYLTSDPQMANVYSVGPIAKQAAKKGNYEPLPRSVPVYVKAEKPLILNTDENTDEQQIENSIKMAKTKGYDSIIYNVGGEKFVEVVVFNPTQVKSAISSKFNPKDPNITAENKKLKR
jgi:hypothetical protein